MNKLRTFVLLYAASIFLTVLFTDLGIVKQQAIWWKYVDAFVMASIAYFLPYDFIKTKSSVSRKANQE